jgi:hypothetical protein
LIIYSGVESLLNSLFRRSHGNILLLKDIPHLLLGSVEPMNCFKIRHIEMLKAQMHPPYEWPHFLRNTDVRGQTVLGARTHPLFVRWCSGLVFAHAGRRLKSARITRPFCLAGTGGSPSLAASWLAIASAAVLSGSAAMWA